MESEGKGNYSSFITQGLDVPKSTYSVSSNLILPFHTPSKAETVRVILFFSGYRTFSLL